MYLYDAAGYGGLIEGFVKGIENLVISMAIGFALFFVVFPICIALFIAAAVKCSIARKEYIIVRDYTLDNNKYIMVKCEYTDSVNEGFFTYFQYTVDDCIYKVKKFNYTIENPYILYRASAPKKYILYDLRYHKRRVIFKIIGMILWAVVLILLAFFIRG